MNEAKSEPRQTATQETAAKATQNAVVDESKMVAMLHGLAAENHDLAAKAHREAARASREAARLWWKGIYGRGDAEDSIVADASALSAAQAADVAGVKALCASEQVAERAGIELDDAETGQ